MKLVNEIFENILVGSSLNPDIQDTNNNITCYGFDDQTAIKAEEEDEEDDDYSYDDEDMMDEEKENIYSMNDIDDYKPYNFQNTVDKIFKTEKKPKHTSENDPRRFEDA